MRNVRAQFSNQNTTSSAIILDQAKLPTYLRVTTRKSFMPEVIDSRLMAHLRPDLDVRCKRLARFIMITDVG